MSNQDREESLSVFRMELLRRKIKRARLQAELGISDSVLRHLMREPWKSKKTARKAELLLGIAIVTDSEQWEAASRIAARIHLDPLSMDRVELRRLARTFGIPASTMPKPAIVAALDRYFQENPTKKRP